MVDVEDEEDPRKGDEDAFVLAVDVVDEVGPLVADVEAASEESDIT